MNKLKLILAASIAATALTLSCSDDGGGDSGGGTGPVTETYTLKNKTNEQFTYIVVYKDNDCREGGILSDYIDEKNIKYSIDNKILTWGSAWSYDGDTIQFKGTTDELIGTWTRTKAPCDLHTYGNYSYRECKEDYDITKAVFAEKTVEITRDECPTDELTDGGNFEGDWKTNIKDCNTIELSKGSEKITWRRTRTSEEIGYKGKSCKYSEPPKAQKEAACKKAWNEKTSDYYWQDAYDEILEADYNKCLATLNLPPELMGDDDYDDYVKAAKPLVKARITPLLKKN